MSFYVIACPKCRNIQCREIRKVISDQIFKCFKCNRSTAIKTENTHGLNVIAHGPFTGRQATDVSKELKKRWGLKAETYFMDAK